MLVKREIMISKEERRDLIKRAYTCACNHGFHEKELSVAHMMMLVVSEVSEMVEADRKSRHSNLAMYEREKRTPQTEENVEKHKRFVFETFVKDSVEDEMADVAIRLYDLCGTLHVEPRYDVSHFFTPNREYFHSLGFPSSCFALVTILTHADGASITEDGSETCLSVVVGCALAYLDALAEAYDMNLRKHIALKMEYNEGRPYKNGKRY